jgi:hypothetical protein
MRKNDFHVAPYDGKYPESKPHRVHKPVRPWPEKEKIYKRRMNLAKSGSRFDVSSQYASGHSLLRDQTLSSSSSNSEEEERVKLERENAILEARRIYEEAEKRARGEIRAPSSDWAKWIRETVLQSTGGTLSSIHPETVFERLKAAEAATRAQLEAVGVDTEASKIELLSRELPSRDEALLFDLGARIRRVQRLLPVLGNVALAYLLFEMIGRAYATEPPKNTSPSLETETPGPEIPASLFDLLSLLLRFLFLNPLQRIFALACAPIPTTLFLGITGHLCSFFQLIAARSLNFLYQHFAKYVIKSQHLALVLFFWLVFLEIAFRFRTFGKVFLLPPLRYLENFVGEPGLLTVRLPLKLQWTLLVGARTLFALTDTLITVVLGGSMRFIPFLAAACSDIPYALRYYVTCIYNSHASHQLSLMVKRALPSKRFWMYGWLSVLVASFVMTRWCREETVIVGPTNGPKVVHVAIS